MSRALFVLRNNSGGGRRHRRHNITSAGRRKLSRLARSRPRSRSGRFMASRSARHNRHHGRRHGRARSVRFNGIGLRSNGIGLRSNGIGLRSNGIGLRSNGMAKGLLGWGLAVVVPIIAGAGTLGLVHLGLMAVDWAAVQLPVSAQPYADKVLGWVEPVGYTAGAMAAASIVGLLSWVKILPPKWAALFGSVAVIGGAAVDAFRFITSEPAPVDKIVAVQNADESVSGISAMGDGGAWALGNTASIHQIGQNTAGPSPAYTSPTHSRMASARMMAQR